MNKFIEKKWFIGIDISKDTLDVSLLYEENYGAFEDLKVKNSIKGFAKIKKWLGKQGGKLGDCALCMEHTGTHGLLLFAWLEANDLLFCVEPGLQIKRSLGMTRGKTDKIDARRIADYLYCNKAKLKPFHMPSDTLIKVKQLLAYRDQMVRIKTSLNNSLKSHQQYEELSGLKNITEELAVQISRQAERIAKIEEEMEEVIQSEAQLNKNYGLARSVCGIGLVTAAFMLVTTNNFTSFENGREYACYAGIAPFEYSSGRSIRARNKVSHLGNRKVKTLLSNGANSAAIWDPQIKAYYSRKAEEGKDHKLIINAISCKLVNRVFAVVRRQTPYVKVYEHNFEKNSSLAT